MKVWTVHEKPHASPILVKEGFAWGAALFGPFWLAAHQAWIPAAGMLVAALAIQFATRPPAAGILGLGVLLLQGFFGRDLIRWSLGRKGYQQTQVVTGANEDEARARLLDARPDLIERSLRAEVP